MGNQVCYNGNLTIEISHSNIIIAPKCLKHLTILYFLVPRINIPITVCKQIIIDCHSKILISPRCCGVILAIRVGVIIILLWLISIVRFPYSFDKLQVLSNKNFESVSNSMLTLVDCKSTESKSSIDFLLTDGKQYYIITAKRFFIWNRYDLSQLMPFSEETSYSYTDCFTKVNVVQSGNTLCLYEEGYVQPYILSFLFLCVVLMLNILGDKSTPEE